MNYTEEHQTTHTTLSKTVRVYAIVNKNTKKYVYGTNLRVIPHVQYTSSDEMLIFNDLPTAINAFNARQCGDEYEIVEFTTEEMDRWND